MKALSIRQPWAWLIANGYKDVENRVWKYTPKLVGDIYIHASKGCTVNEYVDAVDDVAYIDPSIEIPPLKQLERGGLIAVATITGYTRDSKSDWYAGDLAIVLSNVRKIDFIEYTGQLGFFEVELPE